MNLQEFLIKIVSNFKPFQTDVNIENLTVPIGGKHYKVKDGMLMIDEGESSNIQVIKDSDEFVRLKIKNTELEGVSKDKDENIEMLDEKEKVFTRADLGGIQLEYLNIEEKHEEILKRLKPILLFHEGGKDLGALLSAGAIIQLEDKREDEEQIRNCHSKLYTCYKSRGTTIYNLFRSEILENDILQHLEKLEKVYSNSEELKEKFLSYWDRIIESGHPKAYFMAYWDTMKKMFEEINWRLNKGSKHVVIYSRRKQRNKETEKWCEEFAKQGNYDLEKSEVYNLGFTPARKFTITKKIAIEES